MNLTIDRSELIRGLSHVTSVVEKRTTIPILSNILLRATGAGGLTLRATDLDREVEEGVRADVSTPGAVTVPAHTLYDIARKLPDGAQISITYDASTDDGRAGRVVFKAGKSRFTLATIVASDFPDLSPGDLTHRFELQAADLKRLIERTRFAVSTEETRYYLTGIYLHPAKVDNAAGGAPTLRTVATDGHRLAQAEMPLPAGAEGMPGVILPRKTVHEVVRLLEVPDTAVSIAVSEAKIRFEVGTVTLTSKLIDGTFPDYQRVVPKGNDKILKVKTAPLAAAVDRVNTIASERGAAVKIELSDGRMVLSSKGGEGAGSASDEVEADYSAGNLEIGFNAKYLLDILSQGEGEALEMRLADPGSPMVVHDPARAGAMYVLMPMRV
jgi:DNA polymerase-3 subunit beta